LSSPSAIYGLLGFFVICALAYLNITGAVMIGILFVTVLSILFGQNEFGGLVSMPPSVVPTFLAMDIEGAFQISMLSVIFAFFFVDLFDTSGTLIGVGQRGGLLDKEGKLPRLKKALLADSSATVVGAALGTSSTTSYIESASGVAAGGRTGLTAVVVALLFLLSLFFAPLAGSIPAYATAGALMYVAVLMTSSLAHVDWDDISEAAPVLIAAFTMPLTYSIADGIALSFISYAVIKLLSGQGKQVSLAVYILAALFIAKFFIFV
jgi:AGZA family xanthine/uracil permease-like MFS transporter